MIRAGILSVLIALAASVAVAAEPGAVLWYDKPTTEYMSGLPVGNGHIGAMVLGEPGHERIALNHQWLWRGKTREAVNTAIVKSADLLFLLNDDAQLTVAKSSRTGFEPLQRYTVTESATWAQPTISGNRIFVKDVSTLALWTLN